MVTVFRQPEKTVEHHEINMHFKLPADISPEKLPAEVTKLVEQGFVNLAREKMGGWQILNTVKVHVVRIDGSTVPGLPLGYDLYLVRDQNWHADQVLKGDNRHYNKTFMKDGKKYRLCNLIRFWRLAENKTMWLPDRVAAQLAHRGTFKVKEWDSSSGAELLEKLEDSETPTKEQAEYEEYLDREVRGPRTATPIPLQEEAKVQDG